MRIENLFMFGGLGLGVKGRLNNVNENCTVGRGWLPLIEMVHFQVSVVVALLGNNIATVGPVFAQLQPHRPSFL